jgi:hypothetical protein
MTPRPAAEMLEQLDNELNAAGTYLAFAEMRSRLQGLTLPWRATPARPLPVQIAPLSGRRARMCSA